MDEVERAMSEGGLQGVMYHPSEGGNVSGAIYPFMEIVSMYKGVCLLHSNPVDTALLARRFPQATFIMSAARDDAVEKGRGLDNVWYEVVQRPKGPGSEWDFAYLINQLGKDRILFASDLPYYDYRVLQNQLEAANIADSLKEHIAYLNAIAFIQRFRPAWQMPQEPVATPQVYPSEQLWAVRGERLL